MAYTAGWRSVSTIKTRDAWPRPSGCDPGWAPAEGVGTRTTRAANRSNQGVNQGCCQARHNIQDPPAGGCGLFGVLLSYLIRFSGRDYYQVKGAGFGTLLWVFHIGILPFLARVPSPNTLVHGLTHLADHLVWGTLAAYIIVRYGTALPGSPRTGTEG